MIGCSIIEVIMSNVEQPKYDIIALDKNIEIRQYNSMILAEVTVEGTRKEAIKKAFVF